MKIHPNPKARGRAAGAPIPGLDTAPSSSITWSDQQQVVFDWVRNGSGSAFVEAVAGSGKTTTLVEACRYMEGRVALTAFNRKIADEIKRKVSLPNVRVMTFHSAGFAAWRQVAPGVAVDADLKSRQMNEANDVPFHLRSAVSRMVSIAKQSVIGKAWQDDDTDAWRQMIDHFDILLRVDEPPGSVATESDLAEELVDFARVCVQWSRERGKTLIDFDDMLWLPLVEDAPVFQNDWVMVDESQDTNHARRMLASRMVRPGGRTLWVGDRHQAIYGFTGADSDAVDLIVREFGCQLLPLTVTYRCSKAATAMAQTWVPHIEAHEANLDGRVLRCRGARLLNENIPARQDPRAVDDPNTILPGLHPGDAVLCRNTKPLVSLAFRLIREGIGCHVEGRDIGKQLDRLASKWKVSSCADLLKRLEDYRQREIGKLIAKDAPYAIEALNDRVDTLLAVMDGCETVDEVRLRIDRMFKDTEGGTPHTVTLSTIHKAKGREWDRVFILGFGEYMPSRWARQPWELEQEANLCYVAVTRTKDDLVLTSAVEE